MTVNGIIIGFTEPAFEDFVDWQRTDRNTADKLNKLIFATARNPFTGIGKPERLKGDLTGLWSRRIDEKNRLVYRLVADNLQIFSCKGHYGDK
jgi:toxin YoeB